MNKNNDSKYATTNKEAVVIYLYITLYINVTLGNKFQEILVHLNMRTLQKLLFYITLIFRPKLDRKNRY